LNYLPSILAKSIYESEFKDYFKFSGMVLGKALFDKIPVNIPLNPVILRRLTSIT